MSLPSIRLGTVQKLCRDIIHDFDNLPITDEKKPRVGIVGEILVKFLPAANNHLVDLLESEGAEAVMPDLIDFLLYCFYNTNFKAENLGMKKSSATIGNAGIALLEYFRKPAARAFAASKHFDHLHISRIWLVMQNRSFPTEIRPVKAGS